MPRLITLSMLTPAGPRDFSLNPDHVSTVAPVVGDRADGALTVVNVRSEQVLYVRDRYEYVVWMVHDGSGGSFEPERFPKVEADPAWMTALRDE